MPESFDDDGSVPPSRPPPTASEVKKVARKASRGKTVAEENFLDQFRRASITIENEYVHAKAVKAHYRHKSLWSYFLIALMACMLLFQSYLLYMVGIKAWDFKDYNWLLPALLAQNLAQIVGLAVFVVRSLFKDMRPVP